MPCQVTRSGDQVITTALKKYYDDSIEIICADGLKCRCYLILAGVMVDYEEQVLIIGIKANVQCSICHVSPQEQKNLTKTWPLRIRKSIRSKFEQQNNDPIKQRDKVLED